MKPQIYIDYRVVCLNLPNEIKCMIDDEIRKWAFGNKVKLLKGIKFYKMHSNQYNNYHYTKSIFRMNFIYSDIGRSLLKRSFIYYSPNTNNSNKFFYY